MNDQDIRNRTDVEQVKFAPHPNIPSKDVPFKYYHSAQAFMKFINKDGSEMIFRHHFFATNSSKAQEYLDEEINVHHNHQLSYASDDEITQHKMALDPKGTITEQIVNDPDAFAELKWTIENKVRAENGLEPLPPPVGSNWGNTPFKDPTDVHNPDGTDFSDEAKLGGVDGVKPGDKVVQTPTGKVTLDSLKTKVADGPKGPTPLNVSSTNSLPGTHTPDPSEKK